MFRLFRWLFRKRFNCKKEKMRLIRRIEGVQSALSAQNLGKVNLKLDKIVNRLDDPYLVLNKEQVASIDQCIGAIESHANKTYESLLLNKCAHINSCLENKGSDTAVVNTSANVAVSNPSVSNEDKLYEMLGTLSDLDQQIKEIDVRMNAALGVNKNLWEMLNSQRTALKNRMLVINKNYKTLLANQNNLALASEVKAAREVAEGIAQQSETIDVQEFSSDAEFTTNVETEVVEKSDTMNEVFAKHFGAENSDFAYERALEAKLLAEAGNKSAASTQKSDNG